MDKTKEELQAGNCAYYAYVDFGPAMLNGQLDVKENVFRSSGLLKYIRYLDSDSRNFRAYYTFYHDTKSGDFELFNVGPYDTEAVAFVELHNVVGKLEQMGYRPKTNGHSMPAVLVNGNALKC
ncbi:MAG: hypothetical protein ABIP46_08685 [Polaromonas sp.]